MNEELLKRITTDPAVLSGKPVIRGMRITVEQILIALASNVFTADLMNDYPELEPQDLKAVLLYAARLVEGERVHNLDVQLRQMKLLVDVGVGRKVETFLTECGFDSKSVRDIDPSMKDSEILKIALSEERVIVSMDKDLES